MSGCMEPLYFTSIMIYRILRPYDVGTCERDCHCCYLILHPYLNSNINLATSMLKTFKVRNQCGIQPKRCNPKFQGVKHINLWKFEGQCLLRSCSKYTGKGDQLRNQKILPSAVSVPTFRNKKELFHIRGENPLALVETPFEGGDSHYVFKICTIYVKHKGNICENTTYSYIPFLVKTFLLFSKGTTCITLLLSMTKAWHILTDASIIFFCTIYN